VQAQRARPAAPAARWHARSAAPGRPGSGPRYERGPAAHGPRGHPGRCCSLSRPRHPRAPGCVPGQPRGPRRPRCRCSHYHLAGASSGYVIGGLYLGRGVRSSRAFVRFRGGNARRETGLRPGATKAQLRRPLGLTSGPGPRRCPRSDVPGFSLPGGSRRRGRSTLASGIQRVCSVQVGL
jgi:hypothetical protein